MRTLQHYYKTRWAAVLLFIIGMLASAVSHAQEKGIDVNINTDNDNVAWYSIWWVWAIAIALFVIILVAIVSAGKRT